MTVLKSQARKVPVAAEETSTEVEEVRAESEGIKSVESFGKAQPTPEAIARRNRRSRSPIDGRRNILTVKGLDPGMVGRWVDNTPERVEQLLEQGYAPVHKAVQVGDLSIDSGAKLGEVITKRVGGGKEAILMQIPEEWYKADQKEKQRIVDERETAIKQDSKDQNFYGKVTVDDIVPGKRPHRRGVEE